MLRLSVGRMEVVYREGGAESGDMFKQGERGRSASRSERRRSGLPGRCEEGGGGARVPTAAASRFCVVAANYGTWPGLCQTTRGNPVDITSQFVIHRVFLECIRVCVDWAGRA